MIAHHRIARAPSTTRPALRALAGGPAPPLRGGGKKKKSYWPEI
jgi:hypothetical protein